MNVVYAGLLGFVVAFGLGPIVIPVLHRLKFGQMVRDVGPQSHLKKQGTPTMGGLLFLLPLPLAVLLFADNNLEAWALVTLIWSYGMIGLADDLLKVVFKRPLGLKAREKLLFQILFAVAFTWLAARRFHADGPYVLPFHWGTVALPWIFGPLSVLAILGSGNAVNLTDGLDGLAAGAVTLTMAFFAFWGVVHHQMALALVSTALIGSLIGFLRYNIHPARVFMGDTGSLALGAALAGAAIVSRTTLILPIIGLLFVLETLSVIIQVLSFRLSGRRVFRMSPLHHHFELGGWPEERVVAVFWLIAAMGAAVAWWWM
ncbi:phospho-N-acetylmuramoyl-pentapeptide-transferase [Sulfobacillus thermosulfidooxidans]|uniref:phospho-N-acetylmuramoyl-pentapeptide- transferase n=1 Tax=Sulfobacillus thermosulfidooxidans TaxID=28034 RepID=UPI0004002B1A|nr:phospho-N-acetylmuramoyl-pentapeptide-transferase [Sulfobacillus thermosulfidooxidans]